MAWSWQALGVWSDVGAVTVFAGGVVAWTAIAVSNVFVDGEPDLDYQSVDWYSDRPGEFYCVDAGVDAGVGWDSGTMEALLDVLDFDNFTGCRSWLVGFVYCNAGTWVSTNSKSGDVFPIAGLFVGDALLGALVGNASAFGVGG